MILGPQLGYRHLRIPTLPQPNTRLIHLQKVKTPTYMMPSKAFSFKSSRLDLGRAPYGLYGVNRARVTFVPLALEYSPINILNRTGFQAFSFKSSGLCQLASTGDTFVPNSDAVRDSDLDLDHPPYGLYAVKYIDPVSLATRQRYI